MTGTISLPTVNQAPTQTFNLYESYLAALASNVVYEEELVPTIELDVEKLSGSYTTSVTKAFSFWIGGQDRGTQYITLIGHGPPIEAGSNRGGFKKFRQYPNGPTAPPLDKMHW